MDTLILVDSKDNEVGYEEKEKCHITPTKLHRAFSVFIFNSKGQMLIQKRSSKKNTWPGFWTNTCCSHPRKGEQLEDAVVRRLKEELGISCALEEIFKFEYKADYDKKWGENEVDHVFVGTYDGPIKPNKAEVEAFRFVDVDQLKKDVKNNPGKYTPWFKTALEKVLAGRE
ncbi:MAG: isopentenyl-diphosphate Delta-isomerase [Candidatus Aenigmarchaeota archaeon]|nr:isopentenyl-diphosphate Delta-isomerase [Candidatus Aenigmarchaeota archaeon]